MTDREMTALELVETFERESGPQWFRTMPDGTPCVYVSPPYPGIVPTWPRLILERAIEEAACTRNHVFGPLAHSVPRIAVRGDAHREAELGERGDRHEKQHPKPVVTCPVCVWRLAGDIVWRKVSR